MHFFIFVVQAFPMLALPLMMMFFPPRYTRSNALWLTIYLLWSGQGLELFDLKVWEVLGHAISGHSVKHLVAAAATYVVLDTLRHRVPAPWTYIKIAGKHRITTDVLIAGEEIGMQFRRIVPTLLVDREAEDVLNERRQARFQFAADLASPSRRVRLGDNGRVHLKWSVASNEWVVSIRQMFGMNTEDVFKHRRRAMYHASLDTHRERTAGFSRR